MLKSSNLFNFNLKLKYFLNFVIKTYFLKLSSCLDLQGSGADPSNRL